MPNMCGDYRLLKSLDVGKTNSIQSTKPSSLVTLHTIEYWLTESCSSWLLPNTSPITSLAKIKIQFLINAIGIYIVSNNYKSRIIFTSFL